MVPRVVPHGPALPAMPSVPSPSVSRPVFPDVFLFSFNGRSLLSPLKHSKIAPLFSHFARLGSGRVLIAAQETRGDPARWLAHSPPGFVAFSSDRPRVSRASLSAGVAFFVPHLWVDALSDFRIIIPGYIISCRFGGGSYL